MVTGADLILVMERYHLKNIRVMRFFGNSKAHLLSRFDTSRKPYDLPDPMGGSPDIYLESAKLIYNCLEGFYSYLEERFDV